MRVHLVILNFCVRWGHRHFRARVLRFALTIPRRVEPRVRGRQHFPFSRVSKVTEVCCSNRQAFTLLCTNREVDQKRLLCAGVLLFVRDREWRNRGDNVKTASFLCHYFAKKVRAGALSFVRDPDHIADVYARLISDLISHTLCDDYFCKVGYLCESVVQILKSDDYFCTVGLCVMKRSLSRRLAACRCLVHVNPTVSST